MRINKYLSYVGFCSRREADRLIKEGRIEINKKRARLGDDVEAGDHVKVDGQPISVKDERLYFMYHKPRGVICSTDRRLKDNIIDTLKLPDRVFPVGRLDVGTSGLIFLTNDGEFAHCIMHPRFQHEKEYEVTVNKSLTNDFLQQMREGILLSGKKTAPTKVTRITDRKFRIVLTQGWNRQIHRMCEAFNYNVNTLKRIRIMNVNLGTMMVGSIRSIKGKTLKRLLQKLGLNGIKSSMIHSD